MYLLKAGITQRLINGNYLFEFETGEGVREMSTRSHVERPLNLPFVLYKKEIQFGVESAMPFLIGLIEARSVPITAIAACFQITMPTGHSLYLSTQVPRHVSHLFANTNLLECDSNTCSR